MKSSDIDARKLAQHLFEESDRPSVMDALLICILVDEENLSPTDIQQKIYGKRRGGSVDKALTRLRDRGLIILTDVTQHLGPRRIVNWTQAGKQFLESIKR